MLFAVYTLQGKRKKQKRKAGGKSFYKAGGTLKKYNGRKSRRAWRRLTDKRTEEDRSRLGTKGAGTFVLPGKAGPLLRLSEKKRGKRGKEAYNALRGDLNTDWRNAMKDKKNLVGRNRCK